jgi:hypothetical protein
MRVDETTIEKIWRRFAHESLFIFPLRMEDVDFTAIDLYGGPGGGHALRSDGIVLYWGEDTELEYEVELNPGWRIGALVIGSERIPELKEVLPRRPEGSRHCDDCSGQGFTDLPNAPRFLLCQSCWGLGWIDQED